MIAEATSRIQSTEDGEREHQVSIRESVQGMDEAHQREDGIIFSTEQCCAIWQAYVGPDDAKDRKQAKANGRMEQKGKARLALLLQGPCAPLDYITAHGGSSRCANTIRARNRCDWGCNRRTGWRRSLLSERYCPNAPNVTRRVWVALFVLACREPLTGSRFRSRL